MPVYCYRREDNGKLVEQVMTVAEMEKKQEEHYDDIEGYCRKGIWVDKNDEDECEEKVFAFRDIETEQKGTMSFPGNWPLYSDAMGCNPDDAKEAYEDSVRAGVPTRFDVPGKEGMAEFLSPGHRKRYCEAFGFHDRNAGYSDPQPGSYKKQVNIGDY